MDLKVARSLSYIGPRKALLLCVVWELFRQMHGDPDVWRRRGFRSRLLFRQAGLFCWGRKQQYPDDHWSFAPWPEENSPVDTVFKRRSPNGPENFEFVQLKEWVPEDLNAAQSLQSLLNRIGERYPDAGGITIGINVNREASTELGDLLLPSIRNGSIWLFGIGDIQGYNCFLIGDLMHPPAERSLFMHPKFAPGESPRSLEGMDE
jgi:hypothetical protein